MLDALLLREVRLLDPSEGVDRVGDLLIVDGRIVKAYSTVRDGDAPAGCRIVNGKGLIACPGLIDLHCHLREPGYEDKETILTGSHAASRGGFTTICCMPNTNPPIDNAGMVEFVKSKATEANLVRILPIGCVSKGRLGVELAELWELAQAGVVGFSDDGSPVADPNLMRQALSYASALNLPVIDHCEDPALTNGALVNEGVISNRLGLTGWPNQAEESIVARDISLAELTGGTLHIAHLSTSQAVELVGKAKERGTRVTAEVTPHHITLTEEWVRGHDPSGALEGALSHSAYDPATKVNPPLRTERDREALVAGLRSGIIDAIATDHAPQTFMGKVDTYESAEWGISGLETALGSMLSLVNRGELDLMTLVTRLTTGPISVLGGSYRDLATLQEGTTADILLFDPNKKWIVNSHDFASKGKHSPLEGVSLQGKVVLTLVGGRPVYSSLTMSTGKPSRIVQ